MKTCSICKVEKDLSCFYFRKDNLKYKSECKECSYKRNRQNYLANKDKYVSYHKEYHEKNKTEISLKGQQYYLENKEYIDLKQKKWSKFNPEKRHEQRRRISQRFSASKSVANKRNKEWSLSLEEFLELIEKPCYYCNNLLGKKSETGSGLDRLNSDLGYISGNCVSSCKLCNQIKMNILTPEETKLAVAAVLQSRGLL